MSNKENLTKAKAVKNDEFYTMISDIEKELWYYRDQLKGKRILMPCDDPELIPNLNINERIEKKASQFWVYFHLNFKFLGLKEIVATHFSKTERTYGIRYTGGNDHDIYDFERFELKQNGDFRSPEVKKLMKDTDIVITNPPFSLFRDFIDQIIEFNKKFLIIGNKNSYHYKNIFKYIKQQKLWIGYTKPDNFILPNGEETKRQQGLSRWFTNLDINIVKEKLNLYKKYNPIEYPKYDNYDAINIDKVKDIPCDYYEEMGVPITFLDKFNSEQFKILKMFKGTRDTGENIFVGKDPFVKGKSKYSRLLIQRKDYNEN